jgi:hypothetical protein
MSDEGKGYLLAGQLSELERLQLQSRVAEAEAVGEPDVTTRGNGTDKTRVDNEDMVTHIITRDMLSSATWA